MNLESSTIGTDEEICMARESLPEPSHTRLHYMPVLVATRRIEFVKVMATIGDTAFDAWASRVDGKVYL